MSDNKLLKLPLAKGKESDKLYNEQKMARKKLMQEIGNYNSGIEFFDSYYKSLKQSHKSA